MNRAAATDIDRNGTVFAELSMIKLSRPVASEDGEVPAGSSGTIVHIWPSGMAYEVEFAYPFPTVATVQKDDMTPA